MRNGKQQREQRRENFRQMELDAASRALADAGYGQRQDLSLATRIEVILHNLGIKQRSAEMKLSLRELEINMARTALLSALDQEDDGQVKLDDLLQALIISRNLAKDAEAECRSLLNAEIVRNVEMEQLLDASKLLATNRGLTIRTLERRIAANYQDESLKVKELELALEEAAAENSRNHTLLNLLTERANILAAKVEELEKALRGVEVTPAPEEQSDAGS